MIASLVLGLWMALPQVGSGTVTGQIRTTAGVPNAGLRVAALEAPLEGDQPGNGATMLAGIAETDNDGRFRLENVPPGRYYVIAGGLDSPTYYPAGKDLAKATAIAVRAGAVVSGIDFVARAQWLRVRGRVPAAVGLSPVLQTQVVMYPEPAFDLPRNLTTIDATLAFLRGPVSRPVSTPVLPDGSFEFRHVAPGPYLLQSRESIGLASAVPVAITVEDRDVDGLEIELKTAIMTGQVTGLEDGPISGLLLRLTGTSGTVFLSSGDFPAPETFNVALPQGEFRVDVEASPNLYRIESITYGSTNLLKEPMKVDFQNPQPMAIRLVPARPPLWKTVRGRTPAALDPANSPKLVLRGGVLDLQYEAEIAADGSFEFPNVLEGDYSLAASGTPYTSVKTFTVKDQDVNDIEPRFSGLHKVTGRVAVGGGGQAPHTKISFTSTSWHVNLVVWTEPDGSFEVILPNGEHSIMVGTFPEGYEVKSIMRGTTDLLKTPLAVDGSDRGEITIALDRNP